MDRQPSRALLIAAGLTTQLLGAACLVLALASLPIVHDLHGGTKAALASVVASLGAIVCGTLVWRGRLIPLALATGLDVGLGIVLPRGTSGIGALLRILPQSDASTATKLTPLIRNAQPVPTDAMTKPAAAGPIIRAALNDVELSATAFASSRSPTSSTTKVCRTGASNADAQPNRNANR